MDDDDYSARLASALKARGNMHPQVLADHLEVSLQAVRKVLEGKSAAFSVFNHFRACRFLGIDPEWLATGDKQMASADGGKTETERVGAALESLTGALQKADKNTRIALEPLLASMAKEPAGAGKKSHLILRLLAPTDELPAAPHDGPRSPTPGKPQGTRLGSTVQELGGKVHGRGNSTAAVKGGRSKG